MEPVPLERRGARELRGGHFENFLSQRMAWMNKRKSGGGQILYQGLCMHAVNQCVGRAIRNRPDSALILFFDGRYARDNIKNQ